MKNYNILSFILLAIIFYGCNGSKKTSEIIFSFDKTNFKTQYVDKEELFLSVINSKNKKIDSIVYFINDQRLDKKSDSKNLKLVIKDQKLGYQTVKARIYFEGETQEISERIEIVSNVQPKLLSYTIAGVHPHDVNSFTEGLEFYNDTLYESTGQKGASYFRKYDYSTGKKYQQVDLDALYFGEGITILKKKIYQLTWQSNIGFVYNASTLKREKTFTYDKPIEGWGMTNDGEYLYQSDGTEKIWKMNPETLKMIDYINVYAGSNKIKSVNELEFINGKIYGNIWQKDAIAVINPTTGAVEAILNLTDLRKQVTNDTAEVLNGIAYNPKTKTLFVTGKNWDKLFELKVLE
jgi:glutamine cyclotransferase